MTEKKLENMRKKEYLQQYQGCLKKIRRLTAEIQDLESQIGPSAIRIDGLPSGSDQHDLSDYVAKLDEYMAKLIREKNNSIVLRDEISGKICQLTNEDEKDILVYKYILGYRWETIADMKYMSLRNVYYTHGRALDHMLL